MFSGCTALEEIRLPKKLKKIDRYMFDGCTNLKRLYIGDAITEIETGSVYGTALEELHIEAATPPTQKVSEGLINNPPFDKFAYENATVYCPDAKAYYSNYMWQRFKNTNSRKRLSTPRLRAAIPQPTISLIMSKTQQQASIMASCLETHIPTVSLSCLTPTMESPL